MSSDTIEFLMKRAHTQFQLQRVHENPRTVERNIFYMVHHITCSDVAMR